MKKRKRRLVNYLLLHKEIIQMSFLQTKNNTTNMHIEKNTCKSEVKNSDMNYNKMYYVAG